MTYIQAFAVSPKDVRDWQGDLWLFPYYTDPNMIPYDARPGGPAHDAYPHVGRVDESRQGVFYMSPETGWGVALGMVVTIAAGFVLLAVSRMRRGQTTGKVS